MGAQRVEEGRRQRAGTGHVLQEVRLIEAPHHHDEIYGIAAQIAAAIALRAAPHQAAVGEAAGGGRDLSIAGALTLHGVTRPLTIRVRLEIKGDALEATGSTTIRQTDFGMTPISKAGVVKVKDELALSWQIRGTAR